VPFTRIQVAVAGERIAVDAVTRGLAVPVPVHTSLSLAAVGGTPLARVEDVQVAGSGLPAFAREQVLHDANASLDLSRYDLPLAVDDVELTPGRLVLRGYLR
jgi:LmeA-like phospholipid-binding